ncbi:quinate permease [Gymnopus androsaceus JB14]|uniref:Quinate transporter n=1 Tax=Gymnopus androsaceus JB14 TaxID=1447944 RepID=A0A6A4H6W2_9AGAR|nr:quinate permease [Gymnopus androsaceus JB14]
MIGYDSAFIGTSISLASFKKEFGLKKLSTTEFNLVSANIVSMYQARCFFGAIFGYPIGYFLGRQYGLFLSAVVFVIGAAMQTGSSSSTGLGLIYGRPIIVGLAISVASNLAPIYVADWINYRVTLHVSAGRKQWLIAFAMQLIPGGLLALGSPFLSESPRWLVSRDRNDDAVKSLSKIRNLPADHPYLVEEVSAIEAAVAHEKSLAGAGFFGPVRTVFSDKKLVVRLLLGSSLFAWQNATGINAINYDSPTIFKSIGVTGTHASLLTTGVYGIIKLFGALFWLLYVVDYFGRHPTLIVGSVGGAVCMYYTIAIAKPQLHPTTSLSSGGKSAIAFFYLWTVFYSPSWNGTPWVFTAEVFPQHTRTFTQACMAASNWLYSFLIARFTPQMFSAMGYGVYLFFASLMVLSIVFVFLFVPETKQVPLERMEEIFAPGLPVWRAHSTVMRELRLEKHEYGSEEEKDQGTVETFEKASQGSV